MPISVHSLTHSPSPSISQSSQSSGFSPFSKQILRLTCLPACLPHHRHLVPATHTICIPLANPVEWRSSVHLPPPLYSSPLHAGSHPPPIPRIIHRLSFHSPSRVSLLARLVRPSSLSELLACAGWPTNRRLLRTTQLLFFAHWLAYDTDSFDQTSRLRRKSSTLMRSRP